MQWAQRTRRTEIAVAWVTAIGVAAAGAYDFRQGAAPAGLFALADSTRFASFITACLVGAVLATVLLVLPGGPTRPWLRVAVIAVSVVPAVLADPTYSSLMLAVPLIDVRRRDANPSRSAWTLLVVAMIGWLLVSEDTPRVVAEVEAMFGLAIAFFIIVMFGDALRHLDRGVRVETDLAQLHERSRLTGELHDSVGHHLLASSVQLQKAKALRSSDPEESARAVQFASQAVAEAISETRLIVDTRRHRGGFELESAIQGLTKRIVPSSTDVALTVDGDQDLIDPITQLALFRVTQEALSNVVRHASARTTRIHVAVSDSLVRLSIVDDGAGFEDVPNSTGTGLHNMRRRIDELGGSFDITSAPGRTAVIASVPT